METFNNEQFINLLDSYDSTFGFIPLSVNHLTFDIETSEVITGIGTDKTIFLQRWELEDDLIIDNKPYFIFKMQDNSKYVGKEIAVHVVTIFDILTQLRTLSPQEFTDRNILNMNVIKKYLKYPKGEITQTKVLEMVLSDLDKFLNQITQNFKENLDCDCFYEFQNANQTKTDEVINLYLQKLSMKMELMLEDVIRENYHICSFTFKVDNYNRIMSNDGKFKSNILDVEESLKKQLNTVIMSFGAIIKEGQRYRTIKFLIKEINKNLKDFKFKIGTEEICIRLEETQPGIVNVNLHSPWSLREMKILVPVTDFQVDIRSLLPIDLVDQDDQHPYLMPKLIETINKHISKYGRIVDEDFASYVNYYALIYQAIINKLDRGHFTNQNMLDCIKILTEGFEERFNIEKTPFSSF